MSILFSPLTIKTITFKNRIVMSPMCMYSAVNGMPNEWHKIHLGSRAVGGVGLIIVEATSVSPEGRITPADLGIWSEDHVPAFKEIVDFLHEQGAVSGIQIAHAGRKASHNTPVAGGKQLSEKEGGWQTLAPSAIPFDSTEETPQALDTSGIEKVIRDFKNAARRALLAGFKVLEIHAAHGYLLFEFLSPLSNIRTDKYGGSFENRVRLLLEVVSAVKTEWPDDYPLFVRISATDWVQGGWTIDDSVKLANLLKELGVDLIDCSSGGNVPDAEIPVAPGFQVPFSKAIRNTGIMTGSVGLITDAKQAEKILQEENSDLIFLGRELLRNPYFTLQALKELGENLEWPDQYLRAKF